MKRLPIDKLLQWAYRDELPKQTVGELTGWERLIYLGTRVDTSHVEASLPVALGPPHDDALRLDYMVRSLPERVGINWPADRGRLAGDLHPGWVPDSVLATVEREQISVRMVKPELAHASARATREKVLVAAMSEYPIELVQTHARLGNAPNWDMPVKVTRILAGNNRDAALVGRLLRKGWYTEGSRCPLKLDPGPEELISARFTYSVWHQSLVALARACCDLKDHAALPPSVPAAPWVTGKPEKSRILRDIHSSQKVVSLRANVA